jgi:hypothetical protein
MQEIRSDLASKLVRLPGLYRRWELPEVLANALAYCIEDAGAHEDGTPLLAIYVVDDRHLETGIGKALAGTSFSDCAVRRHRCARAQHAACGRFPSSPQTRAAARRA